MLLTTPALVPPRPPGCDAAAGSREPTPGVAKRAVLETSPAAAERRGGTELSNGELAPSPLFGDRVSPLHGWQHSPQPRVYRRPSTTRRATATCSA